MTLGDVDDTLVTDVYKIVMLGDADRQSFTYSAPYLLAPNSEYLRRRLLRQIASYLDLRIRYGDSLPVGPAPGHHGPVAPPEEVRRLCRCVIPCPSRGDQKHRSRLSCP